MEKTKKAILMASVIVLSSMSFSSFAATGTTADTTSTATSSAFEFTTGATVSEITGTSAKVEWEALDGATGYIVHYGTKSAASDGKYETDSDIIDGTGTSLDKLEAKTTYYLAVSAYDKDANESKMSNEVSFTTSDSSEAVSMDAAKTSGFSVSGVNVLASNKIEVSFSKELDNTDWAKREFKLASKDGVELAVSSVELTDSTKLVLTLASDMPASTDYNLTVVSLNDKDGNNIQAWVDGQTSFTTPETFDSLASASGASDSGTLAAAGDAKVLPKTGPEQFLILALALILGFIVVRFRKRIS